MVNHDIGRLPVVERDQPTKVVGIITRSDMLRVYRQELKELRREEPNIALRMPRSPFKTSPASPAGPRPAKAPLDGKQTCNTSAESTERSA